MKKLSMEDRIEALYEEKRKLLSEEADKFVSEMKRTGYLSKVTWSLCFNGDGNPWLGGVSQSKLLKLHRFLENREDHHIYLQGDFDENDSVIIETYSHKDEIGIRFYGDTIADFAKEWKLKLDFGSANEWKKSYQNKIDSIDNLISKLSDKKGK